MPLSGLQDEVDGVVMLMYLKLMNREMVKQKSP